jgi:hypothetical protein
MHLPCSVFSHRQLDLFLWLLKVNNVDDVPSIKAMQNINATLQKMCGINSIPYSGVLGHCYFVNSLSQILAQVAIYLIPRSMSEVSSYLGNGKSQSPPIPPFLSRG